MHTVSLPLVLIVVLGQNLSPKATHPDVTEPVEPVAAATEELNQLRAVSDEVNRSWPEDERFKFRILDVPPALVVGLGIRNQATFSTFINGPVMGSGVPGGRAKGHTWNFEGISRIPWKSHAASERLELYALKRGPSRNPRFLSVMHQSGCFGPGNTSNTAYEWEKLQYGSPDNFLWRRVVILERKGTDADDAPAWWKFRLAGNLLDLPYCWNGADKLVFGSLWPAICSVDTYDLSGDIVQFVSRRTDNEDLEVVSRVHEYAWNHDLLTVEAFCVSPSVAAKIVRLMPPSSFYAGYSTKRISKDKEIIDMRDEWALKFTLERRNGRWMISGFDVSY